MKKTILFLTSCLILAVAACTANAPCLTADRVTQLQTLTINDRDYSIYLRIAGFNEKEAFYELYDAVPAFDACGQADRPAVAVAHVDSTRGQTARLIVAGNTMNIIYESGSGAAVDLERIPIEQR